MKKEVLNHGGHGDHGERKEDGGFERASKYRLTSRWDGVPDEVFMILVFDRSTVRGPAGIARYRREFDDAM
jgi:predicted N-acetyltransferase YhbS